MIPDHYCCEKELPKAVNGVTVLQKSKLLYVPVYIADEYFATTPGFGHQIDIAFKIVHALFVYLRNSI